MIEHLPTVEELEQILNSNEELEIQQNEDGGIEAVPKGTAINKIPKILSWEEAVKLIQEGEKDVDDRLYK